ncbi:23790_t:CDS:2, partial [Racocetra persica]
SNIKNHTRTPIYNFSNTMNNVYSSDHNSITVLWKLVMIKIILWMTILWMAILWMAILWTCSDEGLEMKISLKKKKKAYPTICKLAPTKLKSDAINYNVYSDPEIIPRPQDGHPQDGHPQDGHPQDDLNHDQFPQNGDGIVVRAVHIVHSVREIVNWCS